MNLRAIVTNTELGWLAVAFTERGVRASTMPQPHADAAFAALRSLGIDVRLDLSREAEAFATNLRRTVDGEAGAADLPLDLQGTPFQLLVWNAAAAIPRGQTRSYGWIADQIGKPSAARAVGRALGANPAPVVVPCHRVVRENGALGGFGGGLALKQQMLLAEGVELTNRVPLVPPELPVAP
ncbi:MAG TPA: methylated-DNA--[protein]-cysteine S-methyltransferase [Dehalococcoidia bacterium]|nr:methylated-DNA--[protein]-cysteine S-methyltransferase [Dehalococcoidia bacterium]